MIFQFEHYESFRNNVKIVTLLFFLKHDMVLNFLWVSFGLDMFQHYF